MSRMSVALLFSDSFDADDAPPSATPAPLQLSAPSLTEADIIAARDDGYRLGHTAAQSEQAASVAQTLATIAQHLADAAASAAQVAEESVVALGRLVVEIVCTTCPSLRVRFAEANVTGFIRDLLPALAREPLVTIHVHTSLTAAVAKAMAKHRGAVEIVPNYDMIEGDATVRWPDGAAFVAAEEVDREIRSILDQLKLTSTDGAGTLDDRIAHGR
jgi:hypothetical protein